ncbi:DNA-directed RNA polymerase, alpha subunit [Candidatus Mycoplasma haemominutum 'Birmingham 1']|uniref:DNA-directed RNA polymerase subunit alpha n=2 Tax=Candidatus Mycoplasma haematominutum TaxID=209446 RepID=G8C341_9MOLU|nr:DNA-directed RNA polymerase, alpha subunit [Candidatus Mycoplasma haematominutum 'Birmingham 1']
MSTQIKVDMLERFMDFQIETEVVDASDSSATVIFSPLERGFGNTLGNTMRRLLLSSIPSAAVFAIRISSLPHEYSAIKGVAEDVTQLILAVRKLVLKVDEKIIDFEALKNEPIERWPYLKVRKNTEGTVYAKDIECFAGIEIVNPELRICEVTTDGAGFELDLFCTVDRGYKSSEENRALISTLSLIPIDAIFSPVLMVEWKVTEEKTTKLGISDKLKLSLSTNGSISALEAIWYASKILVNLFAKISEQKVNVYKIDTKPRDWHIIAKEDSTKIGTLAATSIDSLDLGQRNYNILKNKGINTISELIARFEELASFRNLGRKALSEIREKLIKAGYKVGGAAPTTPKTEIKS